jgi:hypothetical protein
VPDESEEDFQWADNRQEMKIIFKRHGVESSYKSEHAY